VNGWRASRVWLSCVVLGCVAAFANGPDAGAADGVTQLTAPETGCTYVNPQLSGNGQWLVAEARCPSTSQDENYQIVRIERASGRMQLLTPPRYPSGAPSVSSDGQRIVFLSRGEFIPGQNPDHLEQVFLFDAVTPRYTQLTRLRHTHARRGMGSPRISGNGETVVFASDADLVSGLNQDGNTELFLFDVRSGQLHQGTQTQEPAAHNHPFINYNGQTVVFLGNHPPFANGLSTGLYRWSPKTDTVQRLLDTPHPDAGAFIELAMSSSGNRVVFRGKHDFLGENPNRYVVLFTLDVATGIVRQVVHSRGCSSGHPALSADGLRLAFVSNCGFDQLNPKRDPNLFLMRLDSGEVVQLTDTDNYAAVIGTLTMDESGRLVAVSIGDELKGMVNPDRLLQVAILNLPSMEAVAEAPIRMVLAEDVSGLVVSRHEPGTIYVSGPKIGIMRSQDEGRSWKLASHGLGSEGVICLVENPNQKGVLLAGTSEAGVYKTTDGGYNWFHANNGLTDKRILALVVDSLMSEVIYAETPTGLYRSQDAGERWQQISQPLLLQSADSGHQGASPASLPGISSTPVAGHRLLSVPGSIGRLLKLSETGAFLLHVEEAEWLEVKTPRVPHWVVATSKGHVWLIGTSQGVYRAEQLNGEWVPVTDLPAEPIPPITIGPAETLYAATYRGIYLSADGALTWSRIGDLHDITRLMPASSRGTMLISALKDGSLRLSRDGGAQWSPLVIPAPSPQGVQSVLFRPVQ
jgi:Tol biopolymer transport system component